jgi:hypothetical protein
MKDYKPYRFAADLEQVEGESFVLVKLGFYWHSWRGLWEFWKYADLIKKTTHKDKSIGLYKTEYFLYSQNHAGFLQYWKSYEDLENWSRKNANHLKWWKEMEGKNLWQWLSAYHEVYLINKDSVETIYNLRHKEPTDGWPGMAEFLPHNLNAKYRARERFIKKPIVDEKAD